MCVWAFRGGNSQGLLYIQRCPTWLLEKVIHQLAYELRRATETAKGSPKRGSPPVGLKRYSLGPRLGRIALACVLRDCHGITHMEACH